jgi:hypothetical protein
VLRRKVPYRLSTPRKARVRSRLQAVDEVIAAVQRSGVECAALDRALLLPTEQEMAPRDKYTTFSRTARDYRKGVHKVSAASGHGMSRGRWGTRCRQWAAVTGIRLRVLRCAGRVRRSFAVEGSAEGLRWRCSARRLAAHSHLRWQELCTDIVHASQSMGALATAARDCPHARVRNRQTATVVSPSPQLKRPLVDAVAAPQVPKWTRLTLRENPRGF